MYTEEHFYSIALRQCKLIGDINFQKLVTAVGSAKNVWHLSKKEIRAIFGIGHQIAQDIGNEVHLRFAEREIQFCEKNHIKIRLRHQQELPFLLNECVDAPAILFQKGSLDPHLKPISLVGTRKMTPYGKQFIQDFFQQVSSCKIASVSGLALGVDTEVHQQSLINNIPTVAVLAHGFQTLYPSKNRKLSEQILENGALLTEFCSDQKPDREHFLQRNRIVAGLSSSTIVVETAFGGGSLSTATYANGYNRDVFALPGKITDEFSGGCNLLITQNKAGAFSSISQLIDLLGLKKPKETVGSLFSSSNILSSLSEDQRIIFDLIAKNPKINLDEIAESVQFTIAKTTAILLELELLGLVRCLSGKQYLSL